MRRLVMLGRKFPGSPTHTVRIANEPLWNPIHEGDMSELGVEDPDLERKIKLESESDE